MEKWWKKTLNEQKEDRTDKEERNATLSGACLYLHFYLVNAHCHACPECSI